MIEREETEATHAVASSRDEISRIVLVKTAALLSQGERPAFEVARATPATASTVPFELEHGTASPLRQVLEALIDRAAPGHAWLNTVYASDSTSQWMSGARAGEAAIELTEKVGAVWRDSRGWSSARAADKACFERLRHRVYLDSDRCRGLFGPQISLGLSDHVTYNVVFDFRFGYLINQLRCHVSTSVWSTPPLHPQYVPHDFSDTARRGPAADISSYARLFPLVVDAGQALMEKHGFVQEELPMGDGVHGLPMFWVVLPSEPASDPADYLVGDPRRVDLTNRMSRTFLDVGDAYDTVVSHSVLKGELLALRRERLDPHYLLIPGGSRMARRDDPKAIERDTAEVVTRLTDLEAEGASRLLSVKSDLEIWRNHLRVYSVVVTRGVFLWDALSTHLPVRRWIKLGKAHRAVELLHQTLLQATGDLGHISTLIRQGEADVKQITDEVSDSYNQRLTERMVGPTAGIRAALTETGLFAQVKRGANEIATEAARVKGAYKDLLDAITHAFDERRVREFDAIQKLNALLGVAVGLVALVTVLDATVEMKPEKPRLTEGGQVGNVAAMLSWTFGVVALLVVGVVSIWLIRKVGRLGSASFRRAFDGRRGRRWLGRTLWPRTSGERRLPKGKVWTWLDPPTGVWQILKEVSTDHLEGKASSPDTDWAELDVRLASEFAMTWDAVSRIRPSARDNRAKPDIEALASQIEQWSMHSLLLTERARRLYRYPLPTLTCLFYCCTHVSGTFLSTGYLPSVSMVATEDLARSLSRLGFPSRDIDKIKTWLVAQSYDSVAKALSRIRELNLHDHMAAAERQAAMDIVKTRQPAAPRIETR